jgi:hypothetical protein
MPEAQAEEAAPALSFAVALAPRAPCSPSLRQTALHRSPDADTEVTDRASLPASLTPLLDRFLRHEA